MRRAGIAILIGAPLLGLIYWVATNTHWVDVKVPMPPQGEALTNPFYAAQRFTETLGARGTRDRILSMPPVDSVIVLADWHWTLSTTRRETLERWVESGGRLVVEGSLAGGEEEFGRWSGIERAPRKGTEPNDSEQNRGRYGLPRFVRATQRQSRRSTLQGVHARTRVRAHEHQERSVVSARRG